MFSFLPPLGVIVLSMFSLMSLIVVIEHLTVGSTFNFLDLGSNFVTT